MSIKTEPYNLADALNPDNSVFVSANAGAGKTTLLANRVLRLLLYGVEPSKILCLTYTNAAAAEMTGRVQKELGKWVMSKLPAGLTGDSYGFVTEFCEMAVWFVLAAAASLIR